MRIHSLPESKRYADTPIEYSILLERQNTVATEVLRDQGRCVVFVGRYPEGDHPVDIRPQLLGGIKGSKFELFEERKGEDEDELLLHIWCAPLMWATNKFDHIIRSVADEEVTNVMFVSLETGESYAPYDGGADLFLSSSSRRNLLKAKYKDWLSAHPEGW